MKRFGLLVVGVIGVLSADMLIDSTANISVDSHIDSSNMIPPPPRNK